MSERLTVKQAAEFASEYTQKNVTTANISYLLNYGRVPKISEGNQVLIEKSELTKYYDGVLGQREIAWKNQLGADLNWALSFDTLKESETTKHVHRLHPYKGKFIPQLVAYFLDEHIDEFKKQIFFKKGDVVLDPFSGSGTTLIQANELGIHAIGIDISAFNTLIANVKLQKADLVELHIQLKKITDQLKEFVANKKHLEFEDELMRKLNVHNNQFFPSPEFKIKVRKKEIDEIKYTQEHEQIVYNQIYKPLILQFQLKIQQPASDRFLEKWYLQPVRDEIDFVFEKIKKIEDAEIKKIATIVLSRTLRSCRATTHADLATLIDPIVAPYYCAKHGKICKPLFSILSWWDRYAKDTLQRFLEFSKLRTNTQQICLNGNSENIDILTNLEQKNPILADLVKNQKIKGIFSSPPYVGLIDYHEQHAYAYDLFGFERKDAEEIGSMSKKQTKKAQQDYADGIVNVLINARSLLAEDFDIFLVANDKYNLYPQIAEKANLMIINQYKRPVLNRTEKDKQAYAEIIFHLKSK